ncbi:DUF3781 domain-containing protein [Flammeovirga sp. OC4]|uniref:DUF3781 domain-containing protein n=1 Tax=Flammeovirga sp. OC4 TaxID=1382345 RepID=UPI0005C522E9|nr:DUF3781 domain-containing protein [Flammeovirga sp. OC4]
MTNRKQQIIQYICYTELVYGRINKKLSTDFDRQKIESLLLEILQDTDEDDYFKKGKNFYISNVKHNVRITINSYTFRVITVDRLDKLKVCL